MNAIAMILWAKWMQYYIGYSVMAMSMIPLPRSRN